MNDDHPNPLPDDVANRLRGTFHAEHGAQIHRMEAGTSAPAASRWAFRRLLVPLVALLAAAGIGGGAVAVFSGDGESQTVQTELVEADAGTTDADLVEVPRAEPVMVDGVPAEVDLDTGQEAALALEQRSIPILEPAATAEEQARRWFDAVLAPLFPLAPNCPEPFLNFEVDGATAIAELCDDSPFDPITYESVSGDASAVSLTFIRAMTEFPGIEHAVLLLPGGQRCVGNTSNANPLCFKPEHLGFDGQYIGAGADCNFLTADGNAQNVASTQVAEFAYEQDAIIGADPGDLLVKVAPGVIVSGALGSLEPETPVILRHEPDWCVVMDHSVWWKIAWDQENDGWIQAHGLWEYGADHGLAVQAPVAREDGELRRPPSPCETTTAEDARVRIGAPPDESTSGVYGRLQITDLRVRTLPNCTQVEVELADLSGVGRAIFADQLADGQVSLVGNHVVFGAAVTPSTSRPEVPWVISGQASRSTVTTFDAGHGPQPAVTINARGNVVPMAGVKVRVAENPARVYINMIHLPDAPPLPPPTPEPTPATAASSDLTECREDQKQQQQRYDVVDVAPDDPDGGLLVHSEPGVNTPVIAVLPWNAAAVPSLSGCMVLNGSPWWRAPGRSISSNASGGWVNARYLGTHRSPQDDLSTVPCDAGPAATSLPNATDGQLDVTSRESSLDRVQLGAAGQDGFRIESTNDCHRLVIPLTEIQGVDIPDYFDIHTMRLDQVPVNQFAVVANSGGTLDIAVGTGISPAEESSTQGQWVGKTWTDTSTGRELGAFYTGAVGVQGSSGTLRVLYGSGQASVRTADNPARLIVDITPFPDPVGQRSGPIVGAGTVLYEPLQRDLEGPGVESSVTVRGYGHGFEGTLVVEVLPWDGVSSPTEVLDQRDAGLLSPVVDAVQVTTAAGTKATSDTDGVFILDANGEFSFDLDFFAPGSAWQIMVEASNPAPDESGLGHLRFLGAGQQIRVADPSVPAEGQRYPEAAAFGTLANADS